MPEAVTSGLGRNGPWLQNTWLRVETRQDDGSISPVGLAGAFRPTERALTHVQPLDAPPLTFARADYDLRPHSDALGTGRVLTLTSRDPARRVTLRREIVLYDRHPYCVLRTGVTNDGALPLPIASIHVVATPAEGRGKLQLAAKPPDWRIFRNGWQSWSPTMSFGGAQLDVQSAPPWLSPEPPQREPGRFASDDVGVLFDPAGGRSLLAGAISARDLMTQVFIDAPAKAIDVRCLADGIAVAPGATLWSERIAVDVTGAPNEQFERYADALGAEMRARVPASAPSGWCSWYYYYTGVTEDDVVRNLRFLETHRRDLPVETVQIDDGYQADIGDWLTVNEKFPHGMAWLASEIKAAGYTPGIWLAPFLLAESSRTFAAHPDWVVRDGDSAPSLATNNWQRNNWALDGSHPDALAWLRSLFAEVCDGWGYEYVKIDFLYAGAVSGVRQDASTTRIQAYRRALAAVRDGVGDRRFILGCGSLMAPSVGYFDGNRIGLDVAPFWRYLTTEERARPRVRDREPDDQLSAETALRNTLNRAWMHGRLWANDPDCVLTRTDRTKLTLDETRTIVSVIGLSGGMVLSSDNLETLGADRLSLLSMLLPALPHAAVAEDLIDRDMPERFVYTYERDGETRYVAALCNFTDDANELAMTLPDGRWHAFELWTERYLGVAESAISFPLVEPHGCRVVVLRPATNLPAVVATDAHIGAGAIDISRESYDEAAQTLRVEIAIAGRHHRQIWFATEGRTVASATFAGALVAVTAGETVAWCALDVDHDGPLVVRFR